jgi:hypothetical protein
MSSRILIVTGACILALTLQFDVAHHGWAGNEGKEFEMGTVTTGVSLAGPHATMKSKTIRVRYGISLAPPARTSEAGLKEGMILLVPGFHSWTPEQRSQEVRGKDRTRHLERQAFNVCPDRE